MSSNDDARVSEIVRIMEKLFGEKVLMYDESFVRKSILNRCGRVKCGTISNYLSYISESCAEAEALLQTLVNTYTEFFRNPLVYAYLEKWVLPKLIDGKADGNELRIWSAGCSTGQEPYSVAMLLDEYNASAAKKIRYRIFATDISKSALRAAKKGEYTEDMIQNITVKRLNGFFKENGGIYKIHTRLKKSVSFSTYDLNDKLSVSPQESIYGDFDLVLCNNLLFYYKAEYQHNILQKLIKSVSENGFLITGETERYLLSESSRLRPVVNMMPIFQKTKNEVQYEV